MKMNEMDNSPVCERATDLIAVLYGEATDRERRDFELHTRQCGSCRAEFAAFADVRESIRDWRDEALAGFVSSEVAAPAPSRKSAMAALRKFFDLSPLWMKGAVGFAVIVFCVLAVLVVMQLRTKDQVPQIATNNSDAVYTQEDVDRAVQIALAKEREQHIEPPRPLIHQESSAPKTANVASREPKSRRPFSKAEREQLAAELRLLSDDEMYLWAEPNDKPARARSERRTRSGPRRPTKRRIPYRTTHQRPRRSPCSPATPAHPHRNKNPAHPSPRTTRHPPTAPPPTARRHEPPTPEPPSPSPTNPPPPPLISQSELS